MSPAKRKTQFSRLFRVCVHQLPFDAGRLVASRFAKQCTVLCRSRLLFIGLATLVLVLWLAAGLFPWGWRIAGLFHRWSPGVECDGEGCNVEVPLKLSELSPQLLLVFIHAKASDRARRDTIRGTWISPFRSLASDAAPIQYRFVIGGRNLPSGTLKQLAEESEIERDLLVLDCCDDSLSGLTARTLNMLQYAIEHFQPSYILKCDDDTFVDVLRIASELERREQKGRLYWGFMLGTQRPMMYGAYKDTKWNHCTYYFPYACGGGYVLSQDVARLVVDNRDHLTQHIAEDMSLGLWLAPYNIERRHDARFNTESHRRGCKEPFLVSHKVSSWEMPVLYSSLLSEGTFCSWRTEWVNSWYGYVYDWNSLPSDCCWRRYNIP